MNDDIKNLMELQTIDLEVQKIEEQMDEGLGELDVMKTTIDNDQHSIIEYREQLELSEKRRRELEALIEDETERIKNRQTKLMNIQTNREYQSILKEIEDTKQSNKEREEELVLLMEQSELIQNKIETLTQQCEEGQSQLDKKTKKVKKAADNLEKNKKKIVKSRDAQAKRVNNKYLTRYERLRERRNGLAMAGVIRGVCLGCNMNIPPQMFNELLREDKILSCPTCTRMMYHLPEAVEE